MESKISASYVAANVVAATFFYLIVETAISVKNKEELLAAYGTFHQDAINQIIHFFGVPVIIWSALIFLAHVDFPFLSKSISIPSIPLLPKHPFTWGTIVAAFYVVFNCKLDTFAGTIYAAIVYMMYVSAVRITSSDKRLFLRMKKKMSNERVNSVQAPWYGTTKSLKIALLMHIFAWYVQIHPGHMIFEGANPALIKSFGMALTAAPLFAFYEGLWFLGINKNLQVDTLKLVEQNTRDLCRNGENMRICAELNLD